MCGISAIISKEEFDFEEARPLLNEIGIRGLHSTGASWLEGTEIKTDIQEVPYYDFYFPKGKTKALIMHCRYSTSNLEYPQPVSNKVESIVHNGVITQAPWETWNALYGYTGENKCDTSLLLGLQKHPLQVFRKASMAVAALRAGGVSFFRNHQRPLWFTQTKDKIIVASTKFAVEKFGTPEPCKAGWDYFATGDRIVRSQIIKCKTDWQTTSYKEKDAGTILRRH